MALINQTQVGFSGGISNNSKRGSQDAGRFMRNMAINEDSDSMILNPAPIKESASVVTDLVKWIVDANPYENVRYAVGDSGNVYKITGSTWTLDHTISGGAPKGQGLIVLKDALYIANGTTITRKYPLTGGAGTYSDDFLSDGVNNLDASVTASGNTYTTPVAISEAAANSITYSPAFDPLVSVALFVTSKGTGNWTVTVHDVNNQVVGTSTVANASLTNGQMNTFTLSAPGRINIGATYHIHVTSTVADGTLQTGTASDLSTAQYNTYFGILISDVDYHPMILHTNGVTGIFVVGNEHYMGVYDGVTYNPNKIVIEPGFKIRTATLINEFVIMGAWKGANIDSIEYGRMYAWDGNQPYFNFKRELTLGTPNAMVNFKNRLFGIFGSNGDISLAPDESSPFRQIQPAPKLTFGSRIEVLPGAMNVWQRRVFFGYSNTNDANAGVLTSSTNPPPIGMEPGVYEFGNQSDMAITYTAVSTESLSFSFQPSQGVANPTNFKIGVVAAFGKDMYLSYQDGATYYVDKVSKGNAPCAFGSWESLIVDEGQNPSTGQLNSLPSKQKRAQFVVISFQALPTGATVTPKYRINRATNWVFGTAAVAGAHIAVLPVSGTSANFYELEYGFDCTATATTPVITGVGLFYDPDFGELDFNLL